MCNEDNNKAIENLSGNELSDKEKAIILKKFICFAISALTSPLLEDMKKAQRVFSKIKKDPNAVFKYDFENYDFYDETLIYLIEDGQFDLPLYMYSEKIKRNVERKFEELEQELSDIFGYPSPDDDKFTRLIKEKWQEKWQALSFSTTQNLTAKPVLVNSFVMKLKLVTVCKNISNLIESQKDGEIYYWLNIKDNHYERVYKAYFNALSAINCGKLRHPTRGRKILSLIKIDELSDLTLPGFVLFFIKAELEEKLREYISSGYGKKFDITAWEKDSYMLTFSSTAWMYNIFYLDHFIVMNIDLESKYKEKLAESVIKALVNVGQMIHNANGTASPINNNLERVYELNEKVLRWAADKKIERRFENELNKYRSYILNISEVKQPTFSNAEKITTSKVIDKKVKMCFYDVWEVSEKLSNFESIFNQIEYFANSRYLRERLSEMEGKVNEEIKINDLNQLKSIQDDVDEFLKFINDLINKTNKEN